MEEKMVLRKVRRIRKTVMVHNLSCLIGFAVLWVLGIAIPYFTKDATVSVILLPMGVAVLAGWKSPSKEIITYMEEKKNRD